MGWNADLRHVRIGKRSTKDSAEPIRHLPWSPKASSGTWLLLALPGLWLMVKSFAPRDGV